MTLLYIIEWNWKKQKMKNGILVVIETVKKCHEEEEEIACEGKLREYLITENDSELLLKERPEYKNRIQSIFIYTL